jgi:hypothetical protein
VSAEKRWLWIEESVAGPFSLSKMQGMANRGEIDRDTLFWAERLVQWRPLLLILDDFEPCRLDEMREVGVRYVELLDTGDGKDCEVCRSFRGKRIPIDEALTGPPQGCTCSPWWRCVWIAVS